MCKKVKYLYLFIVKKCFTKIQLLQRKFAIFIFIEMVYFETVVVETQNSAFFVTINDPNVPAGKVKKYLHLCILILQNGHLMPITIA